MPVDIEEIKMVDHDVLAEFVLVLLESEKENQNKIQYFHSTVDKISIIYFTGTFILLGTLVWVFRLRFREYTLLSESKSLETEN